MGFPGGSDSKESACNAGDLGSIPGLGRSPGGGHGNPLQYSCLENPHGQRSLAGYSSWGCKESDTTERLSTAHPTFSSCHETITACNALYVGGRYPKITKEIGLAHCMERTHTYTYPPHTHTYPHTQTHSRESLWQLSCRILVAWTTAKCLEPPSVVRWA